MFSKTMNDQFYEIHRAKFKCNDADPIMLL